MADVQELSPSVIINPEKDAARLRIPARYDRALLTKDLLIGLITGEGVEVSDLTNNTIRQIVSDPPPDDKNADIEIARATPPVHGVDGYITWTLDQDAESDTPKTEQVNPDDKLSYYDRCTFHIVQIGDRIGRIYPPEPAQDGRDVLGHTLPAKTGKAAKLVVDDSILQQADGTLIAQQEGVLLREPGMARIVKHIHINDYVDFSTGNLDFDGDITIEKGVRDCFIVKATGNIEVKGLIEAATIDAGKNLIASGGFAGRERGNVHTGGNLTARYLDNIQGYVKQDLCIAREVINCDLTIEGRVDSPNGAIIGGRIVPIGEVLVGTLGSAAGIATELVIGSVPTLHPHAKTLARMLDQLTVDAERLQNEKDVIDKNSTKGRMTATDKERETEIIFELSCINAILVKVQRTLDQVRATIDKRRRVDVIVNKEAHPGTMIVLDQRCYRLHETLHGPVRFYLTGKQFVYRRGDSTPVPVDQVAEVKAVFAPRSAA